MVVARSPVLLLLLPMVLATTASMLTVQRSWMNGKSDIAGDRAGGWQHKISISTRTWRH